ncbi:oxidoreductase [Streptomyces sp. MNU89]|uniref:oxidoreductase n=1 Tax=Streptomyces sp. MNU89 TaxID=2560025 RepID=UPI001E525D1A|nr:oxidoreductase [Streptomyces sp. MNU89]MCC9742553.1 SDR family oxidoreductase [Streptomyces sp. MNU89]
MAAWSTRQIPDQHGRTAVVTGANSGLGLVTATELARHGAEVVLAVRNVAAGTRAAALIGDAVPRARTEVRELDLASLSSVRTFAKELTADHPAVDLLVNNAGLVLLGPAHTTADGFELHLGTNMLGHFALTGLLLGTLARADAPRVVGLSSITHKNARLDFDDLMSQRAYDAARAYGRSKLATTVFGLELDRRLRAAGSRITSVLAHPGLSRSNLTPRAWEHRGRAGRIVARGGLLLTQPAERGALPQLFAATAPGVRGGQFFGPSGPWELRGDVTEVRPSTEAAAPATGQRLWTAAEKLTGVTYL